MPSTRRAPTVRDTHLRVILASAIASLFIGSIFRYAVAEDRHPVPAVEDQEAAGELIRNVYGEEYAAARTSSQQLELAQKLLEEGQDTTDNPTGRYVLFRIARDLAAYNQDLALAFRAIDQLGQDYEIDALAMKAEAKQASLAEVRTGNEYQAVSATVEGTIDEAVSASRFDLATELAQACVEAARRARDRDAVRAWAARMHEIEDLANQYAIIEAAMAKLAENPTDAEANSVVGSYQCFVLGDWEQGLPMLALGSDSELQQLAELELAEVADSAAMKSLGDHWWNYGESLVDSEQEAVRQRAAHWYTRALPELAGLTRAEVEQRIEEAGPLAGERRARFDYSRATVLHEVSGPDSKWSFTDVNFSPDGSLLACAGGGPHTRFFDVASGQEAFRLEGHDNQTMISAFSPGGDLFVSTSHTDCTVKLWNLRRREELASSNGNGCFAAAFSANGRLLAYGGQGNTIRVLDIQGNREVAVLAGHTGQIRLIAFSPDSSVIASLGRDSTIRVWDVANSRQVWTAASTNTDIYDRCAFSPDGTLIANFGADGVEVLTTRSGEEVFSVEGKGPVVFSPDGSILATGNADRDVVLWDVNSRRQISTLEGTPDHLMGLAFSPDGSLLAVSGSRGNYLGVFLRVYEFAERR